MIVLYNIRSAENYLAIEFKIPSTEDIEQLISLFNDHLAARCCIGWCLKLNDISFKGNINKRSTIEYDNHTVRIFKS